MRNHKRRYKLLLLASGFLLLAVMLSGVEASYAQVKAYTSDSIFLTRNPVNFDSLKTVYQKKINKYLDKDNISEKYFSFTKEGIEVYSSKTDTSDKKLLFTLYGADELVLEQMLESFDSQTISNYCIKKGVEHFTLLKRQIKGIPFFAINDGKGKLHGRRIALDPGHIAGNLETAKMEKKYVEMKNSPAELIEGELTLATAKILKKKLEAEGATVMLTRDKPNISSFGIDFKKWKDSLFHKSLDSAYIRGDVSFEERNFLLTKATDVEIFRRFFTAEDLRERARKINEFHPDLTLIIHYNVDETNQNWNKPTKKDFNMAFVGGSFTEEELQKPEARIDFLRLLLTDDIENSINFSKYIVQSLVKKTDVPAAIDSCAIYLKGNCINTNVNGVFCRNLVLTRMVKGTICYGESLYQDNINEYKLLSKKEIIVDGIKTSKRVAEVAEAYFEGIMNYVKSKNK